MIAHEPKMFGIQGFLTRDRQGGMEYPGCASNQDTGTATLYDNGQTAKEPEEHLHSCLRFDV